MNLNNFENNSRRAPVVSRYGMVGASQPLAVAAGLKILSQGGNAADAAVAVAAGLNVTEPCNTGLGGDAFCLFFDAATKQIHALNGSGRAPAALTLERIQNEGLGGGLPRYHPYTVTVPGACAAWCDVAVALRQAAAQPDPGPGHRAGLRRIPGRAAHLAELAGFGGTRAAGYLG